MGQTCDWGVLLLVQRVEVELRVIRQNLGTHREELTTDWIVVRVAPVDQREHVRRDTHRHGSARESLAEVIEELLVHEALEHAEQLVHLGDGVLRLPSVVEEGRLVDLREGRKVAPKIPRTQIPMRE